MCGLVLLAAATGFWSCNGDPTESFRGGERVITDPATVFVNQGETKFVSAELLDDQGNQLAADFTVQNVGAGITVEKDPTFVPTSDGSQLQTRTRFIVTGLAATTSSFEVVSGGASAVVQVKIVPAGAGIPFATVASSGPNASDPTVLTVPAPFQFFPDSGVTFNTGPGIIIDRAADGRSITVLPHPGSTATATATLLVEYLPTVPLPTTTDVPLTINAVVPGMAGTDAPATAPEITVPGPGATGGFFDGGTYGASTCGDNTGAPCQLYKITLAEETILDVNLTWSNSADLGLYFMTADGLTETGQACDEHGNGAEAQPEHCEITLPAGTYLAGIVSYGPFYGPPDPNPDWVSLAIARPAP
jgi:hypothetical protein